MTAYAEKILAMTRKRIEVIESAEGVWEFSASIKSAGESTSQEYAGRALLELIQNGHDALSAESPGRVHVLLDYSTDRPAVYVANEGAPFAEENFRGIIEFAQSSKQTGEGIGNKGLGFRSVLLLSDNPEIFSRDPENPADQCFSGYSFRAPQQSELAELAREAGVPERLVAKASPVDLPLPVTMGDDPELLRFAGEGFVTVIKLPLRDDAAVDAVLDQIELVESADSPVLLFLDRLTELHVSVRDEEGITTESTLTRAEGPSELVPESPVVRQVDLDSLGRYLLMRVALDPPQLKAAIEHSVEIGKINDRWLDWEVNENVWTCVALRIDQDLTAGTVYTFLPTEEPSPMRAHVHAPFFADLARRDVDFDVPLNNFLIARIAANAIDMMRILRDGGGHNLMAPLAVDLIAWDPKWSGHLTQVCPNFTAESCIPIADGRTWSCFDEAFLWPADDGDDPLSVITPAAVAHLGYPVIEPAIGEDRLWRLQALCNQLSQNWMSPEDKTVAQFIESVAGALHKKKAPPRRWTDFYAELTAFFLPHAASELKGKRIILDESGRLQKAMGSEETKTTAPVIFLPDDSTAKRARGTRVPEALARRIVYAHSDIDWTKTRPRRASASSLFLQAHLAQRYGIDKLLELIGGLLRTNPNQAVQSAALEYGYALHTQLNRNQLDELAAIPFTVPTAEGNWILARRAVFAAAWKTTGGTVIERLLRFATTDTPELLGIRNQLICDPSGWPFTVDDPDTWKDFLMEVGVNDGLPPTRIAVEPDVGNAMDTRFLPRKLGLEQPVAQMWHNEIRWTGGNHPGTQYAVTPDLSVLPAVMEVETLPQEARQNYAELIALGVSTWPQEYFTVTIYRPGRTRDDHNVHTWPTPLAAYLRAASWVPVTRPDDSDAQAEFLRCSKTWVAGERVQLPDYVPQITRSVRKHLVRNASARQRAAELGVRTFGDEEFSADLLREWPQLLDEGYVAPHRTRSFKNQYRQAWDNILRIEGAWPWQSGEAPLFVTTVGNQLHTISVDEDATILVPDDLDPTKQSLIALTGQHVLVADAAKGGKISELIQQHYPNVTLTSELSVDVYGDDQLILPSSTYPLLVSDKTPWIATIVALVAELKSGFVHATEQSIGKMLQRLSRTRIARVESVLFVVAGTEIDPPIYTKCLPLESDSDPTVVVWPPCSDMYAELEQCASAIASLIGNADLADHLALAFTRLAQSALSESFQPSDVDLAIALQVSTDHVLETRAGIRGFMVDLLERSRILVHYFGTKPQQDEFEARVRNVTDAAGLTTALESLSAPLPLPAGELTELCRNSASLADLRDALSLDFRKFNLAIVDADPTRTPLSHSDRHNQALSDYLELNRTAVIDRVREAYAPMAGSGSDLSDYRAARNLEGLSADPLWLKDYAVPPEALIANHVGKWLQSHSASDDLTRSCELAPLEELRSRNFQGLEMVVHEAEPRVRAWCRIHGLSAPAGWNAPIINGREALEASLRADFVTMGPEDLFGVITDGLGWPEEMPRTLDLSQLDLTEADLLSREDSDVADSERRQHERTHITIDGREMSAKLEDLREVAQAVVLGMTEETLSQSRKLGLKLVSPGSSRQNKSRTVKAGLTMASQRGMSEELRTAVGLAGETAAKMWLERRFPKVEWVSGYRNLMFGDDGGSDSHGYDFRVETASGKKRYFEVKAFSADVTGVVEFELGETEVLAAQKHGNNFEILLVSEARDSARRKILPVPNPLASEGRGRYVLIGRGLRYRCEFDY
jgi:hypothetical protein